MAKEPQTQEATATGSLQNFTFDDDKSWFGVPTEEVTPTEQVLKEIKGATKVVADEGGKPEKVEPLKKEGEEDEEEEDHVFFETEEEKATKLKAKEEGKDEDEEEVEVEVAKEDKKKVEQKPKEGEEDDKFFTTLAGELKDKGIFQNVELKEGEEVTEEKFFELQDAEIEARVEETFQAFFEELDEDGRNFLKFKKAGGRTADFLESYNSGGFDIEEFDENDEAQRTRVLTHYLSTVEKLEPEDVKDRLEWLKEGGKDKVYAKKYFESINSQREELKKEVLKQQQELANQREATAKQFSETLKATLDKTEAIGAFPISATDQKELGSYITKPTVKVGKNKYIPAFQAEIAKIFKADTEEAQKKLLLLAKLVKTDFDVTDLEKTTKTKVVKEAKSKLKDARTGVKPASAGSYAKKSLGDYFAD